MRTRLIALLLLCMMALAACANTTEGLEEDADQNVDEAQEQIDGDEEDDEG